MKHSQASYVPAAGRASLTAFYDPVVSLTMRERHFRSLLIEGLLESGTPRRVLDLGTGTGSLAIALARAMPGARIAGLDPDLDALARARAKAEGEPRIAWIHGRSEELPFQDACFEAATCSLMLHHLEPVAKELALRECLRVLVPGGTLQIADWGRPHDPLMRLAFFGIQLLDGFSCTGPHARGELPQIIARAGFVEVRVRARLRTCWGTLELISATRPATGGVGQGSTEAAIGASL